MQPLRHLLCLASLLSIFDSVGVKALQKSFRVNKVLPSVLSRLSCNHVDVLSSQCKMDEYAGSSSLDLLRLTATELQELLQKNELTSVDLVKQVLGQIESHNEKGLGLKAMLSMAPTRLLLDTASKLDAERAEGHTRGPLHGIPIIVKVRPAHPFSSFKD